MGQISTMVPVETEARVETELFEHPVGQILDVPAHPSPRYYLWQCARTSENASESQLRQLGELFDLPEVDRGVVTGHIYTWAYHQVY